MRESGRCENPGVTRTGTLNYVRLVVKHALVRIQLLTKAIETFGPVVGHGVVLDCQCALFSNILDLILAPLFGSLLDFFVILEIFAFEMHICYGIRSLVFVYHAHDMTCV